MGISRGGCRRQGPGDAVCRRAQTAKARGAPALPGDGDAGQLRRASGARGSTSRWDHVSGTGAGDRDAGQRAIGVRVGGSGPDRAASRRRPDPPAGGRPPQQRQRHRHRRSARSDRVDQPELRRHDRPRSRRAHRNHAVRADRHGRRAAGGRVVRGAGGPAQGRNHLQRETGGVAGTRRGRADRPRGDPPRRRHGREARPRRAGAFRGELPRAHRRIPRRHLRGPRRPDRVRQRGGDRAPGIRAPRRPDRACGGGDLPAPGPGRDRPFDPAHGSAGDAAGPSRDDAVPPGRRLDRRRCGRVVGELQRRPGRGPDRARHQRAQASAGRARHRRSNGGNGHAGGRRAPRGELPPQARSAAQWAVGGGGAGDGCEHPPGRGAPAERRPALSSPCLRTRSPRHRDRAR